MSPPPPKKQFCQTLAQWSQPNSVIQNGLKATIQDWSKQMEAIDLSSKRSTPDPSPPTSPKVELATLKLDNVFGDIQYLLSVWKQSKLIDAYFYSSQVTTEVDKNDSKLIPVHRLVICAYSNYCMRFFEAYPKQAVLNGNLDQLSQLAIGCTSIPVLTLDIPQRDLHDLVTLMYHGKVEVDSKRLASITNSANILQIRKIYQVEFDRYLHEPGSKTIPKPILGRPVGCCNQSCICCFTKKPKTKNEDLSPTKKCSDFNMPSVMANGGGWNSPESSQLSTLSNSDQFSWPSPESEMDSTAPSATSELLRSLSLSEIDARQSSLATLVKPEIQSERNAWLNGFSLHTLQSQVFQKPPPPYRQEILSSQQQQQLTRQMSAPEPEIRGNKVERGKPSPVATQQPNTMIGSRKKSQNTYHAAKYRDRRRQRIEQLFTEKDNLEKLRSIYVENVNSINVSINELIQTQTLWKATTGQYHYKCPVCQIEFTNIGTIRSHLSAKHAQPALLSSTSQFPVIQVAGHNIAGHFIPPLAVCQKVL